MKKLFSLFLLLSSSLLFAQTATIYKAETQAPMPKAYKILYKGLEEQKFWVVLEPNLGKSLAGMADSLGDNYNKNKLEGIRSLVICNAHYANKISNVDPDLLALCPLRVGITHKAGVTTILFARPTVHAQGSAALPIVQEIENTIIDVIKFTAQQAAK